MKTASATVLVKDEVIGRYVAVKALVDPVLLYVLNEYVAPAVPVRSQLQLQSRVPPEPEAPLKSTDPLEVDPQMAITVVLLNVVMVWIVVEPLTVVEPPNVRLGLFAWTHIFGSYSGSSASAVEAWNMSIRLVTIADEVGAAGVGVSSSANHRQVASSTTRTTKSKGPASFQNRKALSRTVRSMLSTVEKGEIPVACTRWWLLSNLGQSEGGDWPTLCFLRWASMASFCWSTSSCCFTRVLFWSSRLAPTCLWGGGIPPQRI